LRIQSLATSTCQRINAWHQEDPGRFKNLIDSITKANLGGEAWKMKTLSTAVCPTFYHFEKRLFINVAVKHVGAKFNTPVWCTPSFRHFVFEGKSQLLLKEPEPAHNLVKLVNRMLPGYGELMPYEYQVGPLLRGHSQVVDLAFLEAVWRYSRKVGEKRFRCGNFMPPPASESSSSKGVVVASKIGESSSSSSSSKPT
jgi:hypothetical protein